MKQFKMIIIKYKISSIIIIFSLIFPIIFFILGITKNYAFLTFAGSILMAGVAFYGFIYDRELNNDKNRRLETNFLKFVSKEVEFNVSQLEKFQSEISILKQQRHDRYVYTKPDIKPQVNITKWGIILFVLNLLNQKNLTIY